MSFCLNPLMAQTNSCDAPVKQCKEDCKKVIDAADKALDDKNKALELADLTIKRCIEHGTVVQMQLNQTRDELDSIWRNPLFIGVLGIAGGFILSRTVLK